MLPLFGKIYIDHWSFFSTTKNKVVLANQLSCHPYEISKDIKGEPLETYQAYLEKNFSGNPEAFWENLIQNSDQTQLVLLLDSHLFCEFVLTYIKSIFPQISLTGAYSFYGLLKRHYDARSLIKPHIGSNKLGIPLEHLDQKEFDLKYQSISPVSCLESISPNLIPIEYLMPSFLTNSSSLAGMAFEAKFKQYLEFVAKLDIEEYRKEIINSGVILDRLSDYVEGKKDALLESEFSWILEEINVEGSVAIIADKLKNYPLKDSLNKNAAYVLSMTDNQTTHFEMKLEVPFVFADLVDNPHLSVLEWLKRDIAQGFGSKLFRRHSFMKCNHSFISWLYDSFRRSDFDNIKQYVIG